jgi:hypothetical protein
LSKPAARLRGIEAVWEYFLMLALESQTEQMFPTENIPITSKCQAHIFEFVQP